MAPKSFHEVALAPIIFGLKNTTAILLKAQTHASTNNIPLSSYLTARLYPDMGDLCYQVYRLTETAIYIVTRTNAAAPSLTFSDSETTFPELLARIEKTLAYVESIAPALLDEREDEQIFLHVAPKLPRGPLEIRFSAWEYVVTQGQPNFWFHVTTMYGILRSQGIPLGKLDFSNGAGLVQVKWLGGGEESA